MANKIYIDAFNNSLVTDASKGYAYARGGVLDIIGTTETVTGSYVSNSLVSTQLFGEVNNGQVTASGGAINVSGKGKVKEISGIFKDNLAKATSLNTNSTIAQGGAINIYAGGTVDGNL